MPNPDISSSVSILSRKVSCPNQTDWNELKRVVRYLEGTSYFNLRLSKKELKESLIGYADADWAEDSLDRKSNSGYIFKMNGGIISWESRKQTVVAISTAESEFVALTEASREAMRLRNLLEDLGEKQMESTTIHEDNRSCLRMMRKGHYSNRTKHMDVKYCYLKDLEDKGVLGYTYCPTENMIADSLTKPIQATRLKKLRILIGPVDHH
ncbi:hypothetical protein JTB14_031369 [Gonioctena quinquepunctata]|nr:hypothetical protein JTB14_031369 [Gonioctena quinquepunctata]